MAIRFHNIDWDTEGMRPHEQTSLGDVTATRSYQIFCAPVDCVVNFVDFYSNEANPPAATTASVTNLSATIQSVFNGSAHTMQVRGTSANGALTSDSISANVRWRLIPSAGNSLTMGAIVRVTFQVGGSGTLSAAIADVHYTPKTHTQR